MATTGEIIWAQLIARKPSDRGIGWEVEVASLVVELPWRTIVIQKTVPLRDFFLRSFSLVLGGSMIRVRIFLLLQLSIPNQSAKSFYRVQLNWVPTVSREKTLWRYRYRYSKNSVTIAATMAEWYRPDLSSRVMKMFLYAPRGWYATWATPPSGSWTPRQILNLALRSNAIVSGLKLQRSLFTKVNTKKSTPRPSPVQMFTPWILAGEGPFSAPYTSQIVTPGYESYYREYTSVNTPGFRSKKRSELPQNPHSLILRKTYDGPGMDRRKGPGTGNTWNSTWCRSGNLRGDLEAPAPAHDLPTQQLAVRRMINAVRDGASSNIALNLAQSKLIGTMLVNTASRISGSIRSLKRGNFSAARNYLLNGRRASETQIRKGNPSTSKSLADNWLELQYGWKPLLSDIEGSLLSLAYYNYGSRAWLTARGSAKLRVTEKQPLDFNLGSPPIGKVGLKVWVNEHGSRVGMRYRVANPELAFLAQTGFTNPINLVWELLPWSFVVDWFLPIGPYLEAMSAYHGLEFKDGFRVNFTRQTTTTEGNYSGPIPGSPGSEVQYRIDFAQTKVIVDRTMLTSWPTNIFPEFRMGLTGTRIPNALALIRQAFK